MHVCTHAKRIYLLRAGPPNGQWEVGCCKHSAAFSICLLPVSLTLESISIADKSTLQLADKILTAANKEFGSNVRFGSIVRTPEPPI